MIELNNDKTYINELFQEATLKRLMFTKSSKDANSNKHFYPEGHKVNNFISNSYLALDLDERAKNAAIDGINKYGIFTSISRSYISFDHYLELENKLELIFNKPSLIINNVSQGHFGYIPTIVDKKDICILDQFVHKSVGICCQYLKGDGIEIDMVRHNNMNDLESKIQNYSSKYKKIWYLTDSVFSMQGDTAPYKNLLALLDKYPNFHLYIDDAHGMSWIGEKGKGHCLHNMPNHERLYIITSLNKGFGATNAAMIFPDQKTKDIIHRIGLPVIFSSPTPHSGITAASAIADIHLSEEIYEKQLILDYNITYFKKRLKELKIPFLHPESHTPIGFIVLGNVEAMSKFGEKMLERGYMMSIASYPSVPLKFSGFRISITLQHTIQDIENLLVNAVACYEELEKEGVYNPEVVWRNINQDKNKIKS